MIHSDETLMVAATAFHAVERGCREVQDVIHGALAREDIHVSVVAPYRSGGADAFVASHQVVPDVATMLCGAAALKVRVAL